MKAPLSLFLLVLLASTAHAQRGSEPFAQEFRGSTVLLATGDTLSGPLVLNPTADVLRLYQPDGTVRTLSAVAVSSFAVQGERPNPALADNYLTAQAARSGLYGPAQLGPRVPVQPDSARVRIYRTFRWNQGRDYSEFRAPAFFEQLSGGPVLLLRRQRLVLRSFSLGGGPGSYAYSPLGRGYPGGPRSGSYAEIVDSYFLAPPTAELLPLRSPKRDLLAAFPQQAKELQAYARENQLDFDNARDLTYLVNYANSLAAGR